MKVLCIVTLLFLYQSSALLTQEDPQPRSADVPTDYKTCSGLIAQSVTLAGPCQQKTLQFFCSMSEYAAKSKAKLSCGTTAGSNSESQYFCDGTVTQNSAGGGSSCGETTEFSLGQDETICRYKTTTAFQGSCARSTQIGAFLDTLCSANMDMEGYISTSKCYSGSQDVLNFCTLSADASKYKADSQCNPNSIFPQAISCQGDYTIQKCEAAPLSNAPAGASNCTVWSVSQYQGSCGSPAISEVPNSPNLDTFTQGFVLKKIYGHKVVVYITKRLPKNILFRALRHIKESKKLVGNDWSSYYLGNFTVPLYRPDIGRVVPAYFEIEIYSDSELQKPAGFIVLTNSHPTAKHDYPVAHWNSHGPSITKQLLTLLASTKKTNIQGNPVKTVIWKLDSLCYAASKGPALVANIGTIPPLLQGLTQDIFNLFSSPDKQSEVIDMPSLDPLFYPAASSSLPDDGNLKLIWNRTQSGPANASPPFSMRPSSNISFGDYLGSYTINFQYHIDMMRTSVREKWIYEDRSYEICDYPTEQNVNVESCVDHVNLPVSADTKSMITIPFLEAVLVTVHDPNGIFSEYAQFYKPNGQQYPVLVLTAKSLPTDLSNSVIDDLMATGVVSIGEKIVLRMKFYLVANSNSIPPPSWIVNPTSVNTRRLQHYVWHNFWAGSHSQQRCYDQYTYGSCAVGCGPVAWMMLFGWVDLLSSPLGGNVYGRYCAYRSGGVSSGSCLNPAGIAPPSNDAGVRTAINNIRNRVDTFCILSSGATWPWDMSDASGYLREMETGLTNTVNYNAVGYHAHSLTRLAAEEIALRHRPAIIGTGWLSHYPLAYGYAWQSYPGNFWQQLVGNSVLYHEMFYINTGWGCRCNGWVGSGTWFAGRATP